MDLAKEKTYTYYNWALTWDINKIYKDIVNCDVTRPSYSDKKRPTHFWLNKRKWYRRMSVWVSTFWVTDVKVIPWWSCWEEEDKIFLFLVSPDKTQYQIWKRPNSCEFEATMITSWTTCTCWYNKFLEVEYAVWQNKIVSSNAFSNWVQSSAIATNFTFGWWSWLVQGRLSINDWTLRDINYWTWSTQVNIWDYVVVRTAWSYTSWQAKRVTWYESSTKQLILDTPWTWFPSWTTEETWITISVYPRWWTTLMYQDNVWPRVLNVDVIWVHENIQSLWFEIIKNKCITSMSVSWWIWNFLTSEWFLIFGNAGLNVWYFGWSELIWEQFNNIIPFRWYNVFTSDRSVKAWVVSTSWSSYVQSIYDLSWDMGLWSKDAFTIFNNSLYILGNNKRLYAASINSSWSANVNPQLDLKSMSEPIIWELELIRPWDYVNIYADEKTMKIFISTPEHTKILIFESDYWFWHIHKVYNIQIKWFVEWFYVWDWLYKYCWITDWSSTSWQLFTQRISCIIWENEANWMSFNSFQEKMMSLIKLNIWPSILNDWTSYVRVDSNRWGFSSHIKYWKRSEIEWVNDYNKIFAWVATSKPTCASSSLQDCEKIENEFSWSVNKDETFGWQSSLVIDWLCQCPTTFYDPSDMVDWYDSKAYYLSDAYNVMLHTTEISRSPIYSVSFVSEWWDRMWFNWFFAQLVQDNLTIGYWEWEDNLHSTCSWC